MENNWISVRERVPEELKDVIAAEFDSYGNNGVVKGFIRCGVWFATAEGLQVRSYDGDASISLDMDVTHWMPLHKPQKEK